jgi:hypothetical protein
MRQCQDRRHSLWSLARSHFSITKTQLTPFVITQKPKRFSNILNPTYTYIDHVYGFFSANPFPLRSMMSTSHSPHLENLARARVYREAVYPCQPGRWSQTGPPEAPGTGRRLRARLPPIGWGNWAFRRRNCHSTRSDSFFGGFPSRLCY